MDQHPSPIARLSRELGDSGTKEILPPTERNLTMLSEGKLEELEKVGLGALLPPGYQYGADAMEQVELGKRIATDALISNLHALQGEAEPRVYSDEEARRQIGNLEAAGMDWMARAQAAEAELAALRAQAPAGFSGDEPSRAKSGDGWRPMESAPKDGTVIDVWRPEGGRDTVFWGHPAHECGEAGGLCDDDWHRIRAPGWVCNTFGEFLGRKHAPFTHWMPLPKPPASQKATLDGSSDERAQAPAPVGGEVVEARNVAHGVLLEAAWEAAAWLGAGDTVAEEKLVPAILAADPDQAYARQALSELGFDVPARSLS